MNLAKKKGFTLIEVVIVLAIAALILVIVFLAVAGAQRGRRDEANAQAAGRLLSQIEQCASNNNGACPAPPLTSGYLTNIKTSAGEDPTDNDDGGVATASDRIQYDTDSAICSGGAYVSAGAEPTNAAVSFWSETASSAQCRDNK